MIGLMGVQNDGKTLVTPNGNVLFAVPSWLARWIQHIQHWIAKSTWKYWIFNSENFFKAFVEWRKGK